MGDHGWLDNHEISNNDACEHQHWLGRKTPQFPPGCDPGVFFFLAMNRTAFLIDGFNLYHSVKSASHDLGLQGTGTKWLDIHSLCRSYLHAIGNKAQLTSVFTFPPLPDTSKLSSRMLLSVICFIP